MNEQVHDNSMDKLPINTSRSSFHMRKLTGNPLSINFATYEMTPLRKFFYRELEEGTNGFSDKRILGSGGFGEVYKAILKDGTVVAVKKLSHAIDCKGELGDFKAEMETIGKTKHPNLVSLLGYCKTNNERFLVYEFMENGSLYDRLHDKNRLQDDSSEQLSAPMVLSWESRKGCCLRCPADSTLQALRGQGGWALQSGYGRDAELSIVSGLQG